jgi:hypothetical protein
VRNSRHSPIRHPRQVLARLAPSAAAALDLVLEPETFWLAQDTTAELRLRIHALANGSAKSGVSVHYQVNQGYRVLGGGWRYGGRFGGHKRHGSSRGNSVGSSGFPLAPALAISHAAIYSAPCLFRDQRCDFSSCREIYRWFLQVRPSSLSCYG